MLKQSLLATLLLTAIAAADVTLVSGCPTDIKICLGEREESLERELREGDAACDS